MTVNWSGKYSFLTVAWTALSVSPLAAIGSSSSQRWMKPSAPGAFCGVDGLRQGSRQELEPRRAAAAIARSASGQNGDADT